MIFLCTFQGHPIMILKYMIITRSFAKVWNFIQNTVFKPKIGDELTPRRVGVTGLAAYHFFFWETNPSYFFEPLKKVPGASRPEIPMPFSVFHWYLSCGGAV